MVTVAVLIVLVAAMAQEAAFAIRFHSLDPFSGPSRIHFCGRDYDRQGSKSAAQVEHRGPFALTQVMRVPSPVGFKVYARLTPVAQRVAVTPALPCTMELYRKVPWGGYQAFVLSGGP